MGNAMELKPIEGETCLYDENGRFLGKYNPATGRGMFAHTFFVDERTTSRNAKFKTKYGHRVPLCEICGYSIKDERYNYCPKCGAKVVN